MRSNQLLDAAVAGLFLVMVTAVAALSVREWILLLARRKLAVLRETAPVWLPDYALVEAKPLRVTGLLALAFALAKELSGEAHMERAQRQAVLCQCGDESHQESGEARPELSSARRRRQELYLAETERRFKGVRRCC
jgi:hypothetical protein